MTMFLMQPSGATQLKWRDRFRDESPQQLRSVDFLMPHFSCVSPLEKGVRVQLSG